MVMTIGSSAINVQLQATAVIKNGFTLTVSSYNMTNIREIKFTYLIISQNYLPFVWYGGSVMKSSFMG
jgi:hypothetical protein